MRSDHPDSFDTWGGERLKCGKNLYDFSYILFIFFIHLMLKPMSNLQTAIHHFQGAGGISQGAGLTLPENPPNPYINP